jgi:hypothetical protein
LGEVSGMEKERTEAREPTVVQLTREVTWFLSPSDDLIAQILRVVKLKPYQQIAKMRKPLALSQEL